MSFKDKIIQEEYLISFKVPTFGNTANVYKNQKSLPKELYGADLRGAITPNGDTFIWDAEVLHDWVIKSSQFLKAAKLPKDTQFGKFILFSSTRKMDYDTTTKAFMARHKLTPYDMFPWVKVQKESIEDEPEHEEEDLIPLEKAREIALEVLRDLKEKRIFGLTNITHTKEGGVMLWMAENASHVRLDDNRTIMPFVTNTLLKDDNYVKGKDGTLIYKPLWEIMKKYKLYYFVQAKIMFLSSINHKGQWYSPFAIVRESIDDEPEHEEQDIKHLAGQKIAVRITSKKDIELLEKLFSPKLRFSKAVKNDLEGEFGYGMPPHANFISLLGKHRSLPNREFDGNFYYSGTKDGYLEAGFKIVNIGDLFKL